ncbi:unnamed protein product [Calicophoron daubneyi]|uniref:G-protein coupled receptors family 1 profile domain-containing protein n=1 Tax=Calicophoron daubneyi TaxID=300641 RepID=A0AAV2TDM5_CALDB
MIKGSNASNIALSNLTTPHPFPSVDGGINCDFIVAFGYVVIQTMICIVGLILNLINFSVYVRPAFSAPAYRVMTFLSLADAATLGFRIPQGYVFLPHLIHHQTDAVLYAYVYTVYVETPLTNMSENISAWFTVVLAIERYISMKHWSIAKRYFTPKNTNLLIILICVIAVIFNLPYFAIQNVTLTRVNKTLQLDSSFTKFSQSYFYAIHSWVRIVVVQIIPLCFLCVSNCLLFVLVSQHNQKLSKRGRTNNVLRSEASCKRLIPEQGEVQLNNPDQTVKSSGSFYKPSSPHRQKVVQASTTEKTSVETNEGRQADDESPKLVNGSHTLLSLGGQKPGQDGRLSVTGKPPDGVQNPASNDRAQRRRAAQTKLTILLIAIILLFLIGQVPQSLAYLRIFAVLGICSKANMERCDSHRLYRMVTINLSQLSFASTFFVYLFLNRDFRNTVRTTFCCWCFRSS